MDNQTNETRKLKLMLKFLGLFFIIIGITISTFVFFPLIYWQIFFAPQFTKENLISPVPKTDLISKQSIQNLFANIIDSTNYQDAKTWFPNVKYDKTSKGKLKTYTISIPKLRIRDAIVSTNDTDLTKHLVNYTGTAYPPNKGNAVIFGHSTLPQLYNPIDYKTIFTYLYKLKLGDEIIVKYQNFAFKYKVENIMLVDPDNTKILEQNYTNSYLTLITCAPPGTVWKRLVVRATIESI